MASILRARKNELTADEIASVKLSNRQKYGEYITYTALSSDGHTEYIVTLNAQGKAVGCTCPATVPCKHRAAAEFEEAWSSPVCGELEAEAEKIIAEEKAAKARKENARIAKYHRQQQQSVWNSPLVVTSNKTAHPAVREAERIVSEEQRKQAPLNGSGEFSLYR